MATLSSEPMACSLLLLAIRVSRNVTGCRVFVSGFPCFWPLRQGADPLKLLLTNLNPRCFLNTQVDACHCHAIATARCRCIIGGSTCKLGRSFSIKTRSPVKGFPLWTIAVFFLEADLPEPEDNEEEGEEGENEGKGGGEEDENPGHHGARGFTIGAGF